MRDTVPRTFVECHFFLLNWFAACQFKSIGDVENAVKTTHFPWTKSARLAWYVRSSCRLTPFELAGRLAREEVAGSLFIFLQDFIPSLVHLSDFGVRRQLHTRTRTLQNENT